MRTCPNCTTELVVDGGERCPVCNAKLSPVADTKGSHEDDAAFEVTEAHDDDRELVGGTGRKSRRHELDVEDEASITSHQINSNADPQPPNQKRTSQSNSNPNTVPVTPVAASGTPAPNAGDKSGISRLSDKEVESISKNLYGNSKSFLNDREKRDLLKKVESPAPAQHHVAHDTANNSDPADPNRPRMAKRTRGVAWFYRNWIQVTGQNDLHDQDEIVINDRPYLLRKKRFSPKFVIALASPIAAVILFFVGSALTPSISGKGRLVGFVTDQSGQPLSQPATIRIADLGQSFKTNGQGFFVSDLVKAGSHKIECVVNGGVVSADYATIVSGEITTLKLSPVYAQQSQPTHQPLTQSEVEQPLNQHQSPAVAQERPAPPRTGSARPSTNSDGDAVSSDPNARLMLDADVEGATLSLNGRVIGAGNLTYARLKPGHYDYEIAKDGYKSVKGTVDLSSGKTTSLAVQLTPQKTPANKPSVPADEQHYQAALAALNSNDYTTAENEFAAAIEARPSYAAAYTSLAELKSKTGRNAEASQDYLRAAEIYRVAGDMGKALIAYNGAVRTDKTSTAALAGRGNLYLARGEQIAAIADYEQLITIDRRNVQAYYGLGLARFSQGNPKQAIKHLKDARSLDPKSADIHEYLMLCYFATDDIKEAKKSYNDFMAVANDSQVKDMKSNPKFGAVLRVVDNQ